MKECNGSSGKGPPETSTSSVSKNVPSGLSKCKLTSEIPYVNQISVCVSFI